LFWKLKIRGKRDNGKEKESAKKIEMDDDKPAEEKPRLNGAAN
jgi:hypothetical protein